MDSDQGKLFIGGISWETTEEKLRDYFGKYGEVVQAVIMRDKVSGRPRGFGFVVFADPALVDRVLQDKHTIDGRVVEAKRAMSREEQHTSSKSGNPAGGRSMGGSGGGGGNHRTKKIFVGGLPPTLTEEGFRKYFEAYGTVTDVVVMYDQNTQRPRGFGFISFDSEDAVDLVLHKTFHDLNGKLVEVKRAMPKDALNHGSGGGGRSMGGGGGGQVEEDFHLMVLLVMVHLVMGMELQVMVWVMEDMVAMAVLLLVTVVLLVHMVTQLPLQLVMLVVRQVHQGAHGAIRHRLVMALQVMVQMQDMVQLLHGMHRVVVVVLLHQWANRLVLWQQGMGIKDMDMVDMVGVKVDMGLLVAEEALEVLLVVQVVLVVINMGQVLGTWVEVMVMYLGVQVTLALGNLTLHKVEVMGLLRSVGLLDQVTMEVFSPGKLNNSDPDPSFVRSRDEVIEATFLAFELRLLGLQFGMVAAHGVALDYGDQLFQNKS
ncbi:hypothetical protein Taro_048663 [Colocasia esculenta]|uniref:RRM domain-containing protein n=1 Tax=Colocasia esculenta TaxID=4460 RepID=A0A843X8S1_COLES|nr:hypothetical protein [Colocasia esculenta]